MESNRAKASSLEATTPVRDSNEPQRRTTSFVDVPVYNSFEQILNKINPFGRYQMFSCAAILYASTQWAAIYSFAEMLGSVEPNWNCTISTTDAINDSLTLVNNSYEIINAPTFRSKQKCERIKQCSNLTPVDSIFKSMLEEWHLICDQEYVPKLLFLILLAGLTVGSLFGGHLGDHLGRKQGFFLSQVLLVISSVLAVASNDWTGVAVSQFINGFFFGIIEVASLVSMVECTSAKYRLIPNAAFQWSLGYMIIALVSYLTRDWRLYLIFINFIACPTIVAFLLFHESPHWLIVRGKLYRAAKVLTEVSHPRWNNARVEFISSELLALPRDSTWYPYSFIDLFKRRRTTIATLMLLLSMITYSIVENSYNDILGAIPGGIHVSILLYGLLRIWIPALIVWLDLKVVWFGRKLLYTVSLGLIGVCFGASLILMLVGFSQLHWSIVTLTVAADLINASVFWMAIVECASVQYPTVVRCCAFGLLQAFRHVSAAFDVLALRELRYAWPATTYAVPVIFIITTFLLSILYIPETKNVQLNDVFDN